MTSDVPLGFHVRLETDFDAAVERVTTALKAEGFGVLTEIDVQSTLKQKIGVDILPYKILGACNPPLAHKAISADPEAGLLLPCNVVVAQLADGKMDVAIVDPALMLMVASKPELGDIADEARTRLLRVVEALRA